MDDHHHVEYHVRDLPTSSVILFPTRGQVFRDIKDVSLKVCLSLRTTCRR